ncbi:MAG: biotin--[acetyl-CoA-carboxylase] ligase [Bacteroidales bacterium]|jgi:BirA family biotin operon repressor/biotin-[acetyl-CoA-carboxylase] ligase|nr:biotin--[acetyl-CoA-carboxylase] ligase [Bacteroidales bacterium]
MHKLIHKDILTSSNQFLTDWIQQFPRNLLEENIPAYSVVYTDYQTKGRGQQEHTWESERGKNLLMSIILYPNILPSHQFLICEQVSLAIADFLDKQLGIEDVKIKWPNDIYIKNKKIAGILVEHTIQHDRILYSIAGIGLNINQASFASWIPNPTSVLIETNNTYDIESILQSIVENIKKISTKEASLIHQKYIQYLYQYNQFARYKIIKTQEIHQLKIITVEPTGLLKTEDPMGEVYMFNFHEIEHLTESY